MVRFVWTRLDRSHANNNTERQKILHCSVGFYLDSHYLMAYICCFPGCLKSAECDTNCSSLRGAGQSGQGIRGHWCKQTEQFVGSPETRGRLQQVFVAQLRYASKLYRTVDGGLHEVTTEDIKCPVLKLSKVALKTQTPPRNLWWAFEMLDHLCG